MDSSPKDNINNAYKARHYVEPCCEIGKTTVVVIADVIVKKLRMNENEVYVEEEIIGEDILLRIKRSSPHEKLQAKEGNDNE